jgi:DNA polymerase/3'-5' exonuclease PolX
MTFKEITLQHLHNYLEISTRVLNVCSNGNIKSINDLKTHLQKKGNFKSLRGCGRKMNKELVKISKWQGTLYVPPEEPEPLTISDYQFEIKAKSLFKKILGERAKNALLAYFNGQLTKEEIEREIISQDFSKIKLRNVGKKTAIEIERYITEVVSLHQRIR